MSAHFVAEVELPFGCGQEPAILLSIRQLMGLMLLYSATTSERNGPILPTICPQFAHNSELVPALNPDVITIAPKFYCTSSCFGLS